MASMHLDKSGAAAVLGVMRALAEEGSGVRANIVGALALAENAVSASAYKPGSILASHRGITVEVGDTDAEGRLCLADAISFVQSTYQPPAVVNIATLTGACANALGDNTAGLFSPADGLAAALLEAAAAGDEQLWRLPLKPEHYADLKVGLGDCPREHHLQKC
jgi:leucyl aminopeptidase